MKRSPRPRWTIRLLPVLGLLAVPAMLSAQDSPHAGIYRIYQGDAEIGREGFRVAADQMDLEITIPLLNARIESHTDFDVRGRPFRFESRVRSMEPDSLRATVSATIGDTTRVSITGAQAAESMIPARPDGVMPSQSVVAAIELARLARGRDTTLQVLVPGSPALVPVRVTTGGDSAVLNLAGVAILIRGLATEASVEIPAQRVRAELFRGDSLPPLAGMKRPRPDYSAPAGAGYRTEEIRVPITPAAGDSFSIAGTLTIPAGSRGPWPLVVMVSGSGSQPRDEELWPLVRDYRPFRQIASRLAREGIASYRYDDRGVDASSGTPEGATTSDLTDDLVQIVKTLRQRPDIRDGQVAVLGHSEGGLMGPLAATRDSAIAALVIMAGPGKPGREILNDQFRYPIETAKGLSAEDRQSQLDGVPEAVENWSRATPWTRWLAAYDPLPTARRLRVPVLILQGALDRQVSAGQADTLAAAIRSGGNRDVTVQVYPGLNHLFLPTAGDGSPAEYPALADVSLPQRVLDDMAAWLSRTLLH